jgi:hypothetical protein
MWYLVRYRLSISFMRLQGNFTQSPQKSMPDAKRSGQYQMVQCLVGFSGEFSRRLHPMQWFFVR